MKNAKINLIACPYCGNECREEDILTCPQCEREGCCTNKGGCMPAGADCICPECEEGEDAGEDES